MDRLELRRFLDEEQAAALKWRTDAELTVKEAEKALEDFEEYVLSVGKSNLSAEDRANYREIKLALREARDELIFFDGVKKGFDAIAKLIRDRLAREELANAGRWVPKIIKPRRR